MSTDDTECEAEGQAAKVRRGTSRKRVTIDQRQRAFARAIAEGMPKSKAQAVAGYKVNRKHANILLRDARVMAEIERVRTIIELARYRRYGGDDESNDGTAGQQ
jgi:hypothetical protein